MKKIIAMLLAFVMMFSIVACGANNEQKVEETEKEVVAKVEESEEAKAGEYDIEGLAPETIIFATANNATNIESIYAQRFMELVEEKSNGQITFDYSEGGLMGNVNELLEGTMYGTYHMTCTAIDSLQSWVPEVSVNTLPNLFDSYEMAEKAFDGEYGQKVSQLINEQTGLEVLNFEWCGYRNICSEKEIKTLEDAKGVLIRVPELQTYIDFAKLTGLSGVTMSWSEAYTSMNSGIIESVEVPLQNIYEQGFYDLGKYVLMSRHIFNTNSIMISADYMAGLPETYQQIIRDAAKEVVIEERAACQANEQDYIKKLEETGCTINEWEAESYGQLQSTFREYWTTAAEGISDTAVELLDAVLACK